MVRILADDGTNFLAAEQIILPFAQMQDDFGAARSLFYHFNGELAAAVGFPAHALIHLFSGTARGHRDLVGDDECGIEAHAELADQVGILLLVAGKTREKFARAGLGDGAQIGNNFVAAHADAVIVDGQRPRSLVVADADVQFGIVLEQAGVMQRLEAQLVAGIRRIGNQFAQENLAV